MTTIDREAPLRDFVITLAGEVFALRHELEELRAQLATEVRTRKVVVVD